MRTLGIFGGTGPESTIDYYKLILAEHRRRRPDEGNPPLLIKSVDFRRLMAFRDAADWNGWASWMAEEFHRLQSAGADFGLIAANTPHVVFDRLVPICRLPLLSIVDAARDEAMRLGYRRLGILGTRLTMEGEFFRIPFGRSGIEIVAPSAQDRDYVDRKYFQELFEGVFREETRLGIGEVIGRLVREHGTDGILLAGTELPLLMRSAGDFGAPLLDTAAIHCSAAVDRILE